MPAILLTGASGTGKTALASCVASDLGIEFLPSSVAAAYKRLGTTYEAVAKDAKRLADAQELIIELHLSAISERLAAGVPFVSDRGADCVVYSAILCGTSFFSRGRCRTLSASLFNLLHRPDVLNVFVPFVPEIVSAAKSAADGRRDTFLTESAIGEIQGATRFALAYNRVPYLTLEPLALAERCEAVKHEAKRRGLNK